MMPNTTALHAMCGALPVSPEDATGIIEATEALKDRQAANEQLSRDLTEAARDEAVGG